jgi:hypothetical protein
LSKEIIKAVKEDSQPIDKQSFWIKYLKETKGEYDDLKFRKICNDVIDRFEQFLTSEELNKDLLLKSNLLLNSIKENKLIDLAEKQISKSAKVLDRTLDKSADYYLQKYFYEKSIYNLKSNYEKKADLQKVITNLTYKDLTNNLDAFYVIEKLRHACDVLTWRRIYKIDIDLDLDYSLKLLESSNISSIPAVQIFHLMYLVLSVDGSSIHFEKLKEKAFNQIDIFPNSERREILDALLTFCIIDVNRGGKAYYDELLNLYDWGIDSEILLVNEYLSPTTFRNYVIAGLRFGSFDKVENFIQDRAQLLEAKHQENAINFNLARVEFYRKDFDKVISKLNQVNYDDVFYAVESKMLLQAAYYEKKEFDALESAIEAFIKFLQRDKTLESLKKNAYLNFCKYLRKFIQFKNINYSDFIEKIKETSPMYNKSWLIQKVKEYQT